MNTLLETLRYFVLITVELIALFLLISALVEIILMYVPEEKIRKKLSGAGIFGNIIAAGFGALTPFCACSTIPMTVGFLNAGVPFGSAISFLIASPLLNPIILGMLGAMVGIKAMAAYFVIAFSCSVLFGLLLERLGAQRYVKNVRLKPASCCAGGEVVDKRSLPFRGKVKAAFAGAWGSLRPIMGYLLIGVALGAGIYGYMPQDFVMKIAGPDNPFAIPVAAVLGIPLYIRSLHPCRNSHTDWSGADGKGHEHRSGHRADYRRSRNGHSRDDHAGKHLQESACGHDCTGHFPDGRRVGLSLQYPAVTGAGS